MGTICETCHQRAAELRGRSDLMNGALLCPTCFENAERAQRAADPEEQARQAAIAADREALKARQLEDRRRPPNPDHLCEVGGTVCGRAEILCGGLLLCRACAERLSGPDCDRERHAFPMREAPVLVLERRVAELEARLAAREAVAAPRKAVR